MNPITDLLKTAAKMFLICVILAAALLALCGEYIGSVPN